MSIDEISDAVVEDKGPSLYEKIVEITDIPFTREAFSGHDDWKATICRYFTDNYPEDANFEQLNPQVQDWVNRTTALVVTNRGAAKAKPLPYLEGLEGDTEETAVTKKRGRPKITEPREPKVKKERVKKEKAVKEPKVKKVREPKPPKEPKVRGPNRYLRAMRALIANPNLTAEELSAEIKVQLNAAVYCIEAYKGAVVAFAEAGYVKTGEPINLAAED